MNNIFITGIGTGVGKTIASACVAEALGANYWKPVQAGLQDVTDSQTLRALLSDNTRVKEELYRLRMPASPHLAAAREGITLQEDRIVQRAQELQQPDVPLVIEGAGGLMVPLNKKVFTIDLIKALGARTIIVAQNYLGSINHCLLTAMALRQAEIPVIGWIFSGDHHSNEDDIVGWSQYPRIARIPRVRKVTREFVSMQAELLQPALLQYLSGDGH
ncbi:dethiobiotin synthase [Chitinophaga cymbidii]|uniref:ATP-dependent dethiobiotin synthetase BioD n=1 Tax=Chitinophaga cymbidii TaxID=1096750 RepID=A0A512RRJ9_9BACT|nr:dethiobiotin synthase [Chitinophaga cymbidii]GEP98325.1 ATP-dependent dethiobiotin synthetase BioD [Chitinophaga cymbidii]